MTALGVLGTVRAHGLRIPDDISVVGFDDFSLRLTPIRRSRLCVSHEAHGIIGDGELLQLMQGQNPSQAISVTAELVIRESSAPPGKERK